MYKQLKEQLNAPLRAERTEALRKLMEMHKGGEIASPSPTVCVNNHIHTRYSFSPYSPSGAVYAAWSSGLLTAGIMDHDSVSGAEEFIEAGEIAGVAVTNGFECRCSMEGTPFEGRRLNNPDQVSVSYVAMHGIPRNMVSKAAEFLSPYRDKRNDRNRAMVDRINSISPIKISFERDVLPLSMHHEGGSVTERHILYALSRAILSEIGTGDRLIAFLSTELKVFPSGSNKDKLIAPIDTMTDYYLLAALKSGFVERFYIDASDELPSVSDFVRVGKELGAVSAYAYLGDVIDSVTGDKKTQPFEDAFLDELLDYLDTAGFDAVTYMPARNALSQLTRIISLCKQHGFFQISGEDVNSPFQSFICDALKKPEFEHLITSTWALIGHEIAATANLSEGMFSSNTIKKMPDLETRTEFYAKIGKKALV